MAPALYVEKAILLSINSFYTLGKNQLGNNLCKYYTLKEVEHNSPLFECGLYTVFSFQRYSME